MLDVLVYLSTYLVQAVGLFIAYVFAAVLIYLLLRRLHSQKITIALVLMFIGASLWFYVPHGMPQAFQYPFFLKTFGPAEGPVLPFKNIWSFVTHFSDFKKVSDIARDPSDTGEYSTEIHLTAK